MNASKSSSGFTLIELLVVVAIIGLLASIVIASMSAVQTKARDTKRISEVNSVQKALALYATANGGFYPLYPAPTVMNNGSAIVADLLAANAITSTFQDPASPTYDYTYQSNSTGSAYTLTFCLETNSIRGYSQGCGNTVTP